jgi:hypothetical protein
VVLVIVVVVAAFVTGISDVLTARDTGRAPLAVLTGALSVGIGPGSSSGALRVGDSMTATSTN